jgi:hypothetical protein
MALTFPFSAIVSQDEMKLAILVSAIDPTVGGVRLHGCHQRVNSAGGYHARPALRQ